MPNVFASITMSLDGFIAGVNDDSDQPLGENGENLHDWILEGDYPSKHNDFFKLSKENRDIFDDMFASTGVLIAGRRTYDIVHGWEGSYPVSGIPAFVLTHTPPSEVPDGHTPFTFVTEGIQHAIKQAKASAGNKNVQIIGGAQTIQQAINSGLCDELCIHMVPQLLGQGIALLQNLDIKKIELEPKNVLNTAKVTHLYYRIKNNNNPMRTLKLQVQISVDGFVAGPDGQQDWMTRDWDDELQQFVDKITALVDCIVMGRKLAEGFIPYWAEVAEDPDNPEQESGKKFTEIPKVLFSHTLEKYRPCKR